MDSKYESEQNRHISGKKRQFIYFQTTLLTVGSITSKLHEASISHTDLLGNGLLVRHTRLVLFTRIEQCLCRIQVSSRILKYQTV